MGEKALVTSASADGSARSVVSAMLRTALVPGGLMLLLTAATWLVLSGWASAGAAALGGLVAIGAFWSGLVGIRAVLSASAELALPGALALYAVQVCVLVGLALVLREQPWLDRMAFSVGLLASGLAYQAGQVAGFLRARILLVDPPLRR